MALSLHTAALASLCKEPCVSTEQSDISAKQSYLTNFWHRHI